MSALSSLERQSTQLQQKWASPRSNRSPILDLTSSQALFQAPFIRLSRTMLGDRDAIPRQSFKYCATCSLPRTINICPSSCAAKTESWLEGEQSAKPEFVNLSASDLPVLVILLQNRRDRQNLQSLQGRVEVSTSRRRSTRTTSSGCRKRGARTTSRALKWRSCRNKCVSAGIDDARELKKTSTEARRNIWTPKLKTRPQWRP
ncbi:unnamed protein product [Oikopleura dioica]|uniref:Uncharacterized protein n=1 Tax=Oikopleura dioica TaxID=34765 RepID=E4WV42_OIKDI|nr:unnamed protein product [Oikopleura dioica]